MKLLTFYLKALLLLSLFSCQPEYQWYERDFSAEEKKEYARGLGNGVSYFYQGSLPAQFQTNEALQLDSTEGDFWREMGVAYLKRGLANKMDYYYGKAVALKPDPWAGFRAYLYLYFYRDYPRAIADFNHSDSIVGSVGYSQGQNHDYMRGIAYYGLKDYPQALQSLSLYIDSCIADQGEEWVDAFAVLYRALAYEKLGDIYNMEEDLNRALRIYPSMADAYFHLARLAYAERELTKALALLESAETNFRDGYFHNRPYVEVLEQIYLEDLEELKMKVKQKMVNKK